MTLQANITAPVHKGQTFGHIEVKLDDTVLSKQPLVALENIDTGNLWQRLSDNVILLFKK